MFIRKEIRTREFESASPTRKNFTRDSRWAFLECDNCQKKFERQIGKEIPPERCNNDSLHICSDCPASSVAGMKGGAALGIAKKQRVEG